VYFNPPHTPQLRFVSLQQGQRYAPITRSVSGIIMLLDADPSAPEEVQRVERVSLGQEEGAAAPEPFEWDPDEQ